MKNRIFLACSLALLAISCNAPKHSFETISQVSTLDALSAGQYDGTTTYGRLKNLGNFGLGTFDRLDGEMIGLDGRFYQVKTDGKAYPVAPSMKTPFADVTSFEADQEISLHESLNFEQLCAYMDGILPKKNGYYAIKVEGLFRYVKTRSVHEQQKPYPTLAEAIAGQVIFEYEQMQGTMVGFRNPDEAAGTSTTGFHFHFISADKSRGGHLLDCIVEDVQISIDHSTGIKVIPPGK